MIKVSLILFVIYIIYLLLENYNNNNYRKSFTHVIHVNGTRGKSSTARLIEAGLRGGDYRVFCKTTGTSPRTIDTNGIEEPINRRGKANIKEQIGIIKKAASQNADILIVECMAVNPELQFIAQNKILKADISIVTNVRRDHLEVMGPTLNDVAIALGRVMPKNGIFITADWDFINYYLELGKKFNSKVILAKEIKDDYGIDFNDNVSIALEICNIMGIDEEVAIDRMKRNYKKDPGVLTKYRVDLVNNKFVDFINGLAINDPDSIRIIYEKYKTEGFFIDKEFILLVNNRGDRIHRLLQHIELIDEIKPDRVWIIGDYKELMKKKLIKIGYSMEKIHILSDSQLKEIHLLEENTLIYAIGNIGDNGAELIEYIGKVGEVVV